LGHLPGGIEGGGFVRSGEFGVGMAAAIWFR
jgi:hypothetical protein